MDWFLYDIGLRHERVNFIQCCNVYNFRRVLYPNIDTTTQETEIFYCHKNLNQHATHI